MWYFLITTCWPSYHYSVRRPLSNGNINTVNHKSLLFKLLPEALLQVHRPVEWLIVFSFGCIEYSPLIPCLLHCHNSAPVRPQMTLITPRKVFRKVACVACWVIKCVCDWVPWPRMTLKEIWHICGCIMLLWEIYFTDWSRCPPWKPCINIVCSQFSLEVAFHS